MAALYREVIKYNPPGFPPNACPTGGKAGNPASVTCHYHITDHCLICISPRGEFLNIPTCRVFNPGGNDSTAHAWKLPINDYLIGKRVREDGVQFYTLHPKNGSHTGFSKKAKYTLYPNIVHDGGVAVDVSDDVIEAPFHRSQNWQKLRKILDNGRLKYKKKKYCGILHVIP
ncbi:uncharacterized protein [Ptychodera flava]|uniref:uncharacterized protein n=1 Tax=Ptychodera flava TaxID=63121 RepID=UPI00396AA906